MTGNMSASKVMAAYIDAGFFVSVPFGDGCAYDLVVDIGPTFKRIQVKTGWHRNDCIAYKGRRRVRDSSHNGMRGYRADEIDFFAVYYPPTKEIYVVPRSEQNGDGILRLGPTLNSQQKYIKWARDYTWEKHVAELRLLGATEQAKDAIVKSKKACA
jgi:hypothetical protein